MIRTRGIRRAPSAWAAVALALTLAACGGPPPSPSPTVAPTPSPTPSPSPTATSTPTPSPEPSPREDRLLGSDGRLTLLLLGTDHRPAHPGNRTDAIMVVSIDPGTGATAVVSIPRDTARLPLPDGSVYQPKVNGLYQSFVAELGRAGAGKAIREAVGGALGVEIDAYVFIGFEGVRRLVDAVGGVEVVLERPVRDPYYWVTSKQRGVFFPAGRNHLDGERALIFARTRRGDNDYERARRQQVLVSAAVATVRARGLSVLPDLLAIARDRVRTDLPLAEASRIFRIVGGADLETSQRVVLGPRVYASGIPGTSSIELRLDVVRDVVARWMPPVEAAEPSEPPGTMDPGQLAPGPSAPLAGPVSPRPRP